MYTSRGNQIVNLKVHIPTNISATQRECLEKFDAEELAKHNKESAGEDSKSTPKNSCPPNTTLSNAWERLKSFMGQKSDMKS